MSNSAVRKAKALLSIREGRRTKVYRDHLGYPTVGIGHRVEPKDKLKIGDVISSARVDAFFERDVKWALDAALEQSSELAFFTDDFIAALIAVNFQMGPKWNKPVSEGGKGFVTTWSLLKRGRYLEAVVNLRKSLWYKQTPVRVEDFITEIINLSSVQLSSLQIVS